MKDKKIKKKGSSKELENLGKWNSFLYTENIYNMYKYNVIFL
jgi:hypothetical protein